MRIDAHVSRCAGETFVFSKGDVATGVRIDIFFGQTEIDDVNQMLFLRRGTADEEIFWFDAENETQFDVERILVSSHSR